MFQNGLISNSSFNNTKQRYCSEFEIKIQKTSKIISCVDNLNVPLHYDFTKIVDIEKKKKGDFVDVIAVVGNCGEIKSCGKNNNYSRTFTLMDETGKIDITVWNEESENIGNDLDFNPIAAFKKCSVSNYKFFLTLCSIILSD